MTRRSPGEGTIIRRRDGRWQGALQVNGTRKTVYGKTRNETHRKLSELRRQATVSGALPHAGTKTLNDLVDRWLETAAPTLKPRTLADYKQTFRLYIGPALGTTRLDRISPDIIQHVYSDLQAQELLRAAHKAHAVLHRAFKLAVLWGWLAENPTERVLRPQYRPERKEVWTPWELNAFLNGARGHWLYPIWVLAIVSGCRLGELRGLAWGDTDWGSGTIHIKKTLQRLGGEWVITEPKTQSGVRTLTLPNEGVEALRMQEAQQVEWRLRAGVDWERWPLVFTQHSGAPLHGATVTHGLKRECQRLGIREMTPHQLRHLHASLLLQEGLPVPLVAKRLGHATPAITMSVYAHTIGDNDRAAATVIEKAIAECGVRR